MKYLILSLIALITGCHSNNVDQNTASASFFNTDIKLQNVDMSYYFDGGSVGLELTDIHGHKSLICVNNKSERYIILKSEEGLYDIEALSKEGKQSSIYLGAIYPDHNGAEEVEFNSELEADILKRIHEMIEFNPEFEDELMKFITTSRSERNFDIEIWEDSRLEKIRSNQPSEVATTPANPINV